jgi:hypothetical protein
MIDISEDVTQETPSFDVSTAVKKSVVPSFQMDRKTELYTAALADDEELDQSKVASILASPDGEQRLRARAVFLEEYKKRQALNTVVSSELPVQVIEGAVQKAAIPESPDTIIEKRAAEKLHTSALVNADLDQLSEAERKFPAVSDALVELSIQMSTREEGFRGIAMEAEKTVAEQSWGAFGSALAKSALIPFYSWTTQSSPSLGEKLPSSGSGSNSLAQYRQLWSMPPEQAIPLAKQIYEEIKSSNTIEAKAWVDGLLDFSEGDASFNNAMSALDVLSVTPIGLARKGLGKTAAKTAAKTVKQEVGYVAGVVKRVRDTTTIPNVDGKLAATGDIYKAADIRAKELVKSVGTDPVSQTLEEGVSDLLAKTPGLFNPESFATSTASAHLPRANRIAEVLKHNWTRFTEVSTGRLNVSRLTPEAEEQALALTKNAIEEELKANKLDMSLLTANSYRAKDNPLNISFVEARYGNKKGQLFKTDEEAYNFASSRLNLADGTYTVSQEGSGFAILRRADINETESSVRDALKTLDNTTVQDSVHDWDFGHQFKRFRGARETVSKFQDLQRGNFTHGVTRSSQFYADMYKPIERMSNTEYKALNRVLKIARNTERVKGDPTTKGVFYSTMDELHTAFLQHEGRLPTEIEEMGYAIHRQVEDFKYFEQNTLMLRDYVRKGYERIQINDKAFDGKIVDGLPFTSKHDGVVAIQTKDGFKISKLSDPRTREAAEPLIREQAYKVAQLRDSGQGFDVFGAGAHVNFVVLSDFKKGPIQLRDILGYREGGRTKYTSKYFLKQGNVSRDQLGRSVYKGDSVILGGDIKERLLREGRALDQARLAIKNGDDTALQTIIADNKLPWSSAALKAKFKAKEWDINTPFSITDDGVSSSHKLSKTVNGKTLEEEIGRFDDTSNSVWNDEGATRYSDSSREGPLKTIQYGEDSAELVDAETLDPLATQVETLSELTKSRYWTDYQVSAAESFVSEFSDLITLGGSQVSKVDIERNPIYYLMKGELQGQGKRASSARVVQNAVINLLDTSSSVQIALDRFQTNLVESLYKSKLGGAATFLAKNAIFKKLDPIQKGRAFAYHTKMGVWNIGQVFLQSTTLHNISFVSPKHGPGATMASSIMRRLNYLPDDADFAKLSSSWARKAIPGWSEDMFLESWKGLKASGFDLVRGDMSIKNDMLDPKLIRGKVSSFISHHDTFFTGTERFVRMTAWNAAYSEYASKFPGIVSKMGPSDFEQVLQRAKTLSGDMTRDANAFWQNGTASGMTQFWGFTARMHDLMTGRRLSAAEKTRLITGNAFLYGIPTALSPVTLFIPWREQAKEYLIENGMQDNTMAQIITDGVMSTVVEGITGQRFDFAGRYGPGEIGILKNLLNTSFGENGLSEMVDLLGGASGSIAFDTVYSSVPLVKDLISVASDEASTADALILQDTVNLLRNVTTVNNIDRATQAYLATNIHGYISRNGNKITSDYSFADALFQGLTGVPPMSVSETFLMSNVVRARENAEAAVSKEAKKYLNLYIQYKDMGREEEANAYRDKARGMLISLGWPERRKKRFIADALKKEEDMNTRIKKELIK